jgi:hypothetical protein
MQRFRPYFDFQMFRHDTMQEHLKRITKLMNVFVVFGTPRGKMAFESYSKKSGQNVCPPEPVSVIHTNF